MLRDPLKFLVFSGRRKSSTKVSRFFFYFQYFSVVHNEPVLYKLVENPEFTTSKLKLEVVYSFNDRRKFSLSSLSFDNTYFWASLVVFL